MLSSSLSIPIALLAAALQLPTPAHASYNVGNPHRALAKRAITNQVAQVDGQSFDFIIAGGGAAGLAVAARLSEWANTTVLVVEAGGDGTDVQDQIDIPGYSYMNSLGGSKYDWAYKTTPQLDANSTVKSWPRGKGLGGSGATNGLFWTKPSKAEYDAWNDLNPDAAEDWGWSEMQKYTMKAETFSPPSDAHIKSMGVKPDASVHGSDGPIQTGYPGFIYAAMSNWIPTWVALGFSSIDLHSGSTHGVSISPSTINMKNYTRSDSKAGYIDPFAAPRPNLVILTGYQVTKVNWNSTTAGSAVAGGVSFSAAKGSTVYTANARKEVILSGGTVGSAQMLQLSGVGPKELLTGLGIDSVVDLPVGYNLQDHYSTSISFSVPAGTEVWGELYDKNTAATALTEYKAGDYATSQWSYVNEGIGYPSMADINDDWTDYAATATAALAQNVKDMTSYGSLPANVALGLADQYKITNDWLSTDVGQLEIIFTMLSGTTDVGIQAAMQHPYSRGTIMINSTDAFSPPVIDPRYLGLGYDVDIIRLGILFARKLSQTAPMNALTLKEIGTSAGLVDDTLNAWIGATGGTEYHPLGTCSMLPQAKGGVVDTKLIVYGTKNLRVIDASIMPLQVSSHLMSSAYAIAEKGSDLIKAQYAAGSVAVSSSASRSSQTTTEKGSPKASSTAATAAGGAANDLASKGMTATTKNIIIGAASAGVALIAIAAIVFFLLKRRNNKTRNNTQSFYATNNDSQDDAWGSGGHQKEAYPSSNAAGYGAAGAGAGAMHLNSMSRLTDALDSAPPMPPAFGRGRTGSIGSMDTAELHAREPMVAGGGGGGQAGGWYHDPSPGSPYHDSPSGTPRSLSPNGAGGAYQQPTGPNQPGQIFSQPQYGNGGH